MSDEPHAVGCAGPDDGHTCEQALAHLWEYLDAEMTELDADQVRRHLDECAGCLSELQVEVVIKRVVRRGCVEHAPADLRLRILRLTGHV